MVISRERLAPPWAEKVQEVLRAQGRTQKWLAGALQIEHTQLSHILAGDPRYIVSDELKRNIAILLGIPYRWFFEDDSPVSDSS